MKNKAAEIIFQKKRERRRRLAELPFEKKIEIVVELQKAAGAIRKDPRHIVWPIQPEEGWSPYTSSELLDRCFQGQKVYSKAKYQAF